MVPLMVCEGVQHPFYKITLCGPNLMGLCPWCRHLSSSSSISLPLPPPTDYPRSPPNLRPPSHSLSLLSQATLAAANVAAVLQGYPVKAQPISSYSHAHLHSFPPPPIVPQATLAAANVAAVLQGYPVWAKPDEVIPFVDKPLSALPRAAPSIVNAKDLKLPVAAQE